MKPSRRSLQLALALGAALCLPLRALADDRLAGYWVAAPGEDMGATFSLSILGKWTIVTAHWDGYAPDLKVRYLSVTSADAADAGTLTADEKLDKLPDAPRAISYEIKGGELFLVIRDTSNTHFGKYHLVKGMPPSAPAAARAPPAGVQPARPNPPRTPPARAIDPNAVLGSWTTEPGASVQVALLIVLSGPTSVKITQLWIKGTDNPVTLRAADYAVTFGAGGGRGTFTKSKVDAEGPQVPQRLDYSLVADALVVTVDDGAFIGQYRLVRKQK